MSDYLLSLTKEDLVQRLRNYRDASILDRAEISTLLYHLAIAKHVLTIAKDLALNPSDIVHGPAISSFQKLASEVLAEISRSPAEQTAEKIK